MSGPGGAPTSSGAVGTEPAKAAVGRAAAALVESGMRVGLGTGSTAVHAVRAIAEGVRRGTLRDLALVPTSTQTQTACWELGMNLVTLNDPAVAATLDLTIDGADEVDPAWDLIKGGGGALLNEKVAAHASTRYVIVVDESKLVPRLGGSCPVPVEVVPLALAPVRAALERRGFRTELRIAIRKQGPVITDNGNLIVDAWPAAAFDAGHCEGDLAAIPGVVENGIFTGCVTDLLVGGADGVHHERRAKA